MPILQIRDKDGKFVAIPAINGKSAYEQAKEGGYKGTEEEFIAILNGLMFPEDTEHRKDFNNPHKVTASQVNALSLTGGTLTGKSVYFNNGNARITGAQDYIQLDVFDSSKDDENKRQLVLNGKNTTDLKDAVVLTTLENGEQSTYAIYGEHNADELGISRIKTGTYKGGGFYGEGNASYITYEGHDPPRYIKIISEDGSDFMEAIYGMPNAVSCVSNCSVNTPNRIIFNETIDANTGAVFWRASVTGGNTDDSQARRQMNSSKLSYYYIFIW